VLMEDDTTNSCEIAICGRVLGIGSGDDIVDNEREMAIIRAGLHQFRVVEILSGNFGRLGFFLIVVPMNRIEKAEELAEGCWSFTRKGQREGGRIVKVLSDLGWRAWEKVGVPRLEEDLDEDEGEEEEQED